MYDIQSEFWLPPEILDGGFRMDPFKFGSRTKSDPFPCIPTQFPYDICSSPAGFSEVECDEDDFLAGLTRRLTRASLDGTYKCASARHHVEDGCLLSRSPQSTLNQIGSWSGRGAGSGNGSPNGPSLVSSPTTTPLEANSDAWNFIYHAAGQVARLRMNAGDGPFRNHRLPVAPRIINPVHPVNIPHSGIPNIHFREARGDKVMKQPGYIMWNRQVKSGLLVEQQLLPNRRNRVGLDSGPFLESERMGRQVLGGPGQSVGWPSQRAENQSLYCRSNMKVAFLGGGAGGVKRECAGTGVFLPRSYGNNPTDSRKKTGTVVPALDKNSEDLARLAQAQPRFITDHDILISKKRAAAMLAQQVKNGCPDGNINHELRLPKEWTY